MFKKNRRSSFDDPTLIFHRINPAHAEQNLFFLDLWKSAPGGLAVIRLILAERHAMRMDQDPFAWIADLEQRSFLAIASEDGVCLAQKPTGMEECAK